ncbi:hypothetical protein ID866_9961 [Astraeus odoratus]|nr:hypothetical protein ID866_9961 [Astraeus odoratus]
MGFKLLVHTADTLLSSSTHIITFGDNMGVIEDWQNHRHRNHKANKVFKCLHSFILQAHSVAGVQTQYVLSKHNPADDPSQGIYPPQSFLLLRVPIPHNLIPLIANVSDHPSEPTQECSLITAPTMCPSKQQHPRTPLEQWCSSINEEDELICQALLQ